MIQAWQNNCKKLMFLGSSCIYPRMAPQLKESCLLTSELEKPMRRMHLAKISRTEILRVPEQTVRNRLYQCHAHESVWPSDNYHPPSHVLPALIRRFHEAKVSRREGSSLLGTGTPLWEFLYVDDLADACVYLMNTYSSDETVNLGTGKELTIRGIDGTGMEE